MTYTYKGKVDWWIGLSILAGTLIPAGGAIQSRDYWLLAVPLSFGAFMLIFCYPQEYVAAEDGLRIRAGLRTRMIPWSTITSVSPSSDSASSLALSMDRVLIQHAGGEILVAPEDQDHFFDDVQLHCPQLSRHGMNLAIRLN